MVLVEGESDAAAVTVLAARRGVRIGEHMSIVPANGITNYPRLVSDARHAQPSTRVVGLYDVGEERHVARALALVDGSVPTRGRLEELGFFACERDLEDELIRAIGVDGVLVVLAREGEIASFERMSAQPAQRDRPLPDRLHRFLGTRATRKIRYGRLLAEVVPQDRFPRPLALLLDALDVPEA